MVRIYSASSGACFHDQSKFRGISLGRPFADKLSELFRPVSASRHPSRSPAWA
jgi:hypothetical protein